MINRDLDLYIAEHYKKSNNALLLTGARPNLGFYLPMPIEEFIGLVCKKENIPVIKQYPPEY